MRALALASGVAYTSQLERWHWPAVPHIIVDHQLQMCRRARGWGEGSERGSTCAQAAGARREEGKRGVKEREEATNLSSLLVREHRAPGRRPREAKVSEERRVGYLQSAAAATSGRHMTIAHLTSSGGPSHPVSQH